MVKASTSGKNKPRAGDNTRYTVAYVVSSRSNAKCRDAVVQGDTLDDAVNTIFSDRNNETLRRAVEMRLYSSKSDDPSAYLRKINETTYVGIVGQRDGSIKVNTYKFKYVPRPKVSTWRVGGDDIHFGG